MFLGLEHGSGLQKMLTPFPIKRDRGFLLGFSFLHFAVKCQQRLIFAFSK